MAIARILTVLLIVTVVPAIGCRGTRQALRPADPDLHAAEFIMANSGLSFANAPNPVVTDLAGPQPVETYIGYALAQNSQIQAARMRRNAAAMRVPQAGSLKDPMLDVTGWPFFPNTPQTASGRMTVDMMVSQEIPWRGKLPTRVAAAQAEVRAAQAQLAAAELKAIEEVKLAYFELFYVERAIEITQQDIAVLDELIIVANSLYERVQTSQQDVLRLQAERDNTDGELIRLRQMLASAQAELARVLHVSPETPMQTLAELPAEETNYDLNLLYQQAVATRPELQAMLAQVQRGRREVDLARLEYYPDITLKAGWGEMTTNRAIAPSADGIDNVAVGLSLNLPIYRDRLAAAVREAESNTAAAARDYDELRDETERDIKRLFTEATSQQELEILLREAIIPKTEQALNVSVSGYQVGEVEFADLITNWRELLRFHLNHLRVQTQLRQSLSSLERLVGGLPGTNDVRPGTIEDIDLGDTPESLNN